VSRPGNAADEASIWLVDGFNVLCTGLLGGRDRSAWWSATHREELLGCAAALDREGREVWVVFDGERPVPEPPPGARVRTLFVPSADAWLLARLRGAEDPSRIAVVTADRGVADRARGRGARVVSPSDFLARCRET
jgi:hypothetical protein